MVSLASTNMTKTEWHCENLHLHCMHTLKSASRYVREREKERCVREIECVFEGAGVCEREKEKDKEIE